jgi:hypothetical protein
MKCAPKIFGSCKPLSFYRLSALAAFFLISACATPPKQSGVTITGSAHPQVAKRDSAGAEIEKRLREEYRHWKGTRHRLGGTGSRGIDCSGFVKAIYKDVFNLDLPRTTRAQVRAILSASCGYLFRWVRICARLQKQWCDPVENRPVLLGQILLDRPPHITRF